SQRAVLDRWVRYHFIGLSQGSIAHEGCYRNAVERGSLSQAALVVSAQAQVEAVSGRGHGKSLCTVLIPYTIAGWPCSASDLSSVAPGGRRFLGQRALEEFKQRPAALVQADRGGHALGRVFVLVAIRV